MKTRLLSCRLAIVGLALAVLAACSSSKEVTRGDARVAGPQVATSASGSTSGSAANKNEPPPKERMPNINSRAKLLFEDANKAFDAQKKSRKFDFPSLKRKYSLALDADGQLAEAAYNLGVIAEREGKKDEAISHYKDALRRKPTLKEAAENLAVLAQNTGDTQTAAGIYQDILRSYPEDAAARARLAELYRQGGDTERAIEFAREALIRDPKTLPAYKVMMKTYLERKQLSLAKLVALRATKLDENDPELYHSIGLILLQEQDSAKARLQFKKAVEVRPDYQPAHVILAKMALDDGNFKGAEEHLRRILQQDGKNAEAHLNLGIAYRGQGQLDKAMAEYDIAEKLNPDMPGIYLARGVVIHKGKNAPERGLELYRKYIAMAGEVSLPADATVFKLIREAEETIAQAAEMKRAEEEAKRMEEEAKAAEDAAKKEEAAQKAAAKEGGKDAKVPATGKDDKKSAEKVAEKPAPKKAAPPAAVPAKGTQQTKADSEASDEPLDSL